MTAGVLWLFGVPVLPCHFGLAAAGVTPEADLVVVGAKVITVDARLVLQEGELFPGGE